MDSEREDASEPERTSLDAELAARLVPITSADDPRTADYRELREAELVRGRGVFIAEGLEVVRTLVTRGRFPVRSLLVAEKHVERMADVIARTPLGVPTYVASPEVLSTIAGFDLHRGCLAAGVRTPPPALETVLAGETQSEPEVIIVAEAIANHDNVGGLFRNAAAFGAKAVLLDPRSADPLYRKSIRVSMGAALTLPWTRLDPWPDALGRLTREGWEIWALALGPTSRDLVMHAATSSARPKKVALLFGTEGTGLTEAALAGATHRFRIPMAAGVDSLNVATTSAVALFALQTLAARAPQAG